MSFRYCLPCHHGTWSHTQIILTSRFGPFTRFGAFFTSVAVFAYSPSDDSEYLSSDFRSSSTVILDRTCYPMAIDQKASGTGSGQGTRCQFFLCMPPLSVSVVTCTEEFPRGIPVAGYELQSILKNQNRQPLRHHFAIVYWLAWDPDGLCCFHGGTWIRWRYPWWVSMPTFLGGICVCRCSFAGCLLSNTRISGINCFQF